MDGDINFSYNKWNRYRPFIPQSPREQSYYEARSPSQLTQYATIANKGHLATIKYRYDYPYPQPQPHY